MKAIIAAVGVCIIGIVLVLGLDFFSIQSINVWWLLVPIATTAIAVGLLANSVRQAPSDRLATLAKLAKLVPECVRLHLILGVLLIAAIRFLPDNNLLYLIVGIGPLLCIIGGTRVLLSQRPTSEKHLTAGDFGFQDIDDSVLISVVNRCVQQMGIYLNAGEPKKIIAYATKEECHDLLNQLGLQPLPDDHFILLYRFRKRPVFAIATYFGWSQEVVETIRQKGR